MGINKSSKIVVYDNLGIYMSPRVWWMFKVMGHSNISVLDGGLPAWKNKNLQCEPTKDQIENLQGNFEATYRPELVSNAKLVLENLNSKKAVVIDARSEGRFNGTVPEPREELKRGHIPHSINLPFKDVLDDGKIKNSNELANIFGNLNLGDKPLIFTCGSGITACIIKLASELVLKNEKSVYDGSWTEWGQLKKVPIEN